MRLPILILVGLVALWGATFYALDTNNCFHPVEWMDVGNGPPPYPPAYKFWCVEMFSPMALYQVILGPFLILLALVVVIGLATNMLVLKLLGFWRQAWIDFTQ
jgi:hypothetical protein